MKKRLVFPLFNMLVGAVLGAVIGYYISRPGLSLLLGALGGLALGLLAEFLLGRLDLAHWLYRRRVLLLVLLEIPLAVFVVGPYAYVIVEARPDPHPICCETPLDYGAATYEDVQILTADGVTLAGWYVPPRRPPGPVIVLLHGARSDRRGAAWHARQLIEAGYGVLLYDQRSLGESTGDKVSFGWDGPDLLAVVDDLAGRPEVDPDRIAAVGLSGGGHIALNAAYLAPDRLAALWLDGIQAQQIADFPEAQNAGESFATLINAQILKMAEFHQGRPAPPAFVRILAKLDRPPLVIIAGGLDDFERRVSRNYAGVIGPNARLWLIDQAGHVGGPAVMPDEYRRQMLDFFQTTLGQ
ncbi:MAG: alpha/beta fold hydrolase [Chloroflexota bacterium]